MDTLDGSHGVEFTHLPVVYEDDLQIASVNYRFRTSEHAHYELVIQFH